MNGSWRNAVKKSDESILCKQCRKKTLKFPTKNYSQPRKFCCHKCATDFYKENFPQGKDHHLWKGSSASYITQHQWIQRNYGKASKCEDCSTTKAKRYHWANISGRYLRKISDYKQLCVSCHLKFDHSNKHGDKCRRGHTRPPEAERKYPSGKWKQCSQCRRAAKK